MVSRPLTVVVVALTLVAVALTLVAVALTLVAVAGCGVYHFNPRGKSEYSSIAVNRFDNNTPEFGLEDRLTNQITTALIEDGTLRVVTEENADVVLSGTLTGYERKPYEYDETDEVISYSVNMTFDITLRNSIENTDIWQQRVSKLGVYAVAGETEEDGQSKAISFLVEDIINKTTKSW